MGHLDRPRYVHLDRPRYIDTHIAKTLRSSPIVGVIGQRQVGKTTTIEKHAGRQYVSLDNQADLTVATQDPLLMTGISNGLGLFREQPTKSKPKAILGGRSPVSRLG